MDSIILRMALINRSLRMIKEYNVSASGPLLTSYTSIGNQIQEFFDYLKEASELGIVQEKALYERVFGDLKSIELLFLPGGLKNSDGSIDADLLLVCASRASRAKKKFLFLCDTEFIKRIHETGALIPQVRNLGILHHYSTGGNVFVRPKVGDAQDAVRAEVVVVFETIPGLIKQNIQNKELKVVLRCCSGGEQDHLKPAEPKKVYSIGILLPTMTMSKDDWDNKMKDRILVKQSDGGLTQIFIPKSPISEPSTGDALRDLEEKPICISVSNLPELKPSNGDVLQESEKVLIKKFSHGVLKALSEQNPLYIDPFDVCILGDQALVKKCGQQKNFFAESFQCFLAEWQSPVSSRAEAVSPDRVPLKTRGRAKYLDWQRLGISKEGFQGFFRSARSLKDEMCIHKDTYAAHLLNEIKGEYVAVFKTYYAGYRAYKEQMVKEASSSHEVSTPKAIIVTRDNQYMMRNTTPQTLQDEEAEKSETNSRNPSAGGGGGAKR